MRTIAPNQKLEFSRWLDAIRWVAALVVVVNHAGGVLLRPLSETPQVVHPLPQYAYSFVAGFARYAVVVFFVMSGYLVGGSWLRSSDKSWVNLRNYLFKRLTRLYVVLIPMLLLTPLLMLIGVQVYPGVDGRGIYPMQALQTGSASTALCNAIYLQDVLCEKSGGNQALWSLSHEFWYYVAFPLMFMGPACAFLGIFIVALLTAFQFSHVPMLEYFLVWLIGVLVATLPRLNVSLAWSVAAFVMLLLISRLKLQFGDTWEGFEVDFLLALAFGVVLLSMRDSTGLRAPVGGITHEKLSAFSYTLYCSHMPTLFLYSSICMATIGVGHREIPTNMLHWAVALTGILVAVVAAWLLSLVTERNTERVRLFVASLFYRARVEA